MTKIVQKICFFAVLILSVNLYATDVMKDVIAAPVPFNPHTHILKIMNLPIDYNLFTLEVYDIAGARVVSKSYTVHSQVNWNGRNSFGK